MMNKPIVINDGTGAFVMSGQITRVVKTPDGSRVFVRVDSSAGGSGARECFLNSPLTPREVRNRIESDFGCSAKKLSSPKIEKGES